MTGNVSAAWHKASYDRFLQDRLPQLLANRLPLVGYQAKATSPYSGRIVMTLAFSPKDVAFQFEDIPVPDTEGIFELDEQPVIIVPIATEAALDQAEIHCVGEQLYAYLDERLGQAPPSPFWEPELVRAWIALDLHIQAFLQARAQRLDTNNWLSRCTHLRRILIPNRERVIAPGQFGRVCPFEMPEGPNIGRVFTVALGAEIREGRLVVVDEHPTAGLGPAASMIPFLEHNDPNRVLMGANMLRQWVPQPEPEPALVRTGHEPDAPDFWIGRNLLTAFISWGEDTFAAGIVVSESCARRFAAPYPLEPGDKMSNRHGAKGVVSRVLPDEHMPHLTDGTPVDLVYNDTVLHTQMNPGQLREALMGRVARAEGEAAVVPPFGAPDEVDLRARLERVGLPESGMEQLRLGRGGPTMPRPSTVGWVYWGRLAHLARRKLHVVVDTGKGQMQGVLEHAVLLGLGAHENLREYLNTRAIRREDGDTLAVRLAAGPVEQASPPTPMFAELARRLRAAGIQAALEQHDGALRLAFRWALPTGEVLDLARPVDHPWLRGRQLNAIGAIPDLEAYAPLVETNERLGRMLDSGAPERLLRDTLAQLEERVQVLFATLLTPDQLRFRERQRFSGRTVITPGAGLRPDQVGLAKEIAWPLFGPLVVRELGDEAAVRARDERAAKVLDAIMARSWVIVNRVPSLTPTALLAFHPVCDPNHVIRLHPLVCELLNADFDGDQVAVMLPITAVAQREAGERLSVAAHLARDPELLRALLPPEDALWGLAELSRSAAGREEIADMVGIKATTPGGFLSQETLLVAMRKVLAREGIESTLERLNRLMQRGFAAARDSGASLSPFLSSGLERPPTPVGENPADWESYAEELREQLAAGGDLDGPLGPQYLAVRSSGQGLRQLSWLVGSRGTVRDVRGEIAVIRHGYDEGLTPEEMWACVVGARQALAQVMVEWQALGDKERERSAPAGFNVLARARRSRRPGIVFARAAVAGEADPLDDVAGRLLVGVG